MATLEEAIQQKHFPNDWIKANLNVIYTAYWLNNKFSAYLKPYKLTHEQFNVLRILRGSHPKSLCQKDILSRMMAPNSNLTLIVKKLVGKELITVKQSDRDRREYIISISRAGLALLKELDKSLKTIETTSRTLSESESFHLNALLDKLRSV